MSSKDQNQEYNELAVKFSVIPETLQSPFKELFPNFTEGLVIGNPGSFVYHPQYGKNADLFYNFPIRKDDVWIRTFPRSGTGSLLYSDDSFIEIYVKICTA